MNPTIPEAPKQHYALVFYPGRALTPEELTQREAAIAAWVKQVTDMGIWLDPRTLAPAAAVLSNEGSPIESRMFSTIVFFDSPSNEQALEIAGMHPSVQYGTTLEVRRWTSPRETGAKQ
jgi:hypothetical protein